MKTARRHTRDEEGGRKLLRRLRIYPYSSPPSRLTPRHKNNHNLPPSNNRTRDVGQALVSPKITLFHLHLTTQRPKLRGERIHKRPALAPHTNISNVPTTSNYPAITQHLSSHITILPTAPCISGAFLASTHTYHDTPPSHALDLPTPQYPLTHLLTFQHASRALPSLRLAFPRRRHRAIIVFHDLGVRIVAIRGDGALRRVYE